ncbi:hypothetical protein RFI_12504 [Reticulomyxa filosa]|uniref:Transmembrane protein n=1 Tax=Reticulomyxa filosa TaxID=46433 RepID=X6NFH5_RETFI|nr:hypothetical protein RFI_12504 [Reticulomyxa filosa]|eukprot:ETO24653.1 hypothetical protein RFI_12504 [Reticulomyxa filosa]
MYHFNIFKSKIDPLTSSTFVSDQTYVLQNLEGMASNFNMFQILLMLQLIIFFFEIFIIDVKINSLSFTKKEKKKVNFSKKSLKLFSLFSHFRFLPFSCCNYSCKNLLILSFCYIWSLILYCFLTTQFTFYNNTIKVTEQHFRLNQFDDIGKAARMLLVIKVKNKKSVQMCLSNLNYSYCYVAKIKRCLTFYALFYKCKRNMTCINKAEIALKSFFSRNIKLYEITCIVASHKLSFILISFNNIVQSNESWIN